MLNFTLVKSITCAILGRGLRVLKERWASLDIDFCKRTELVLRAILLIYIKISELNDLWCINCTYLYQLYIFVNDNRVNGLNMNMKQVSQENFIDIIHYKINIFI